jgi:hypothetical protein
MFDVFAKAFYGVSDGITSFLYTFRIPGFPLGKQKGERMPQVSFARDITPLFRNVEISHMARYGIKLNDYTFMPDPDNADKVLGALSPHEGDRPCMPSGGPYWTADQFALFTKWQDDGYPAVSRDLGKERLLRWTEASLRAHDCEGWEFDGDFNPAGVQ